MAGHFLFYFIFFQRKLVRAYAGVVLRACVLFCPSYQTVVSGCMCVRTYGCARAPICHQWKPFSKDTDQSVFPEIEKHYVIDKLRIQWKSELCFESTRGNSNYISTKALYSIEGLDFDRTPSPACNRDARLVLRFLSKEGAA